MSFVLKNNNSKIKGEDKRKSLIQQLLDLLALIATMPSRFANMGSALTQGTSAFVLGIEGIDKSFKLISKGIGLWLLALLNIIIKYFACLISFIITMPLCAVIHGISFVYAVIISAISDFLDNLKEQSYGYISIEIDDSMRYIDWHYVIKVTCYSCFGIPIKITDLTTDLDILEEIGDKIDHDFKHKVPRYMKPSLPTGRAASKSLDKAIN